MLCQGCAPIPTRTLTQFASPWRTKQFTDPVSDAGAQCWPDDEANERDCSDCCGRSGGLRPCERGKRGGEGDARRTVQSQSLPPGRKRWTAAPENDRVSAARKRAERTRRSSSPTESIPCLMPSGGAVGARRPTSQRASRDPEDAAPRRTSSSPSDDPPAGVSLLLNDRGQATRSSVGRGGRGRKDAREGMTVEQI